MTPRSARVVCGLGAASIALLLVSSSAYARVPREFGEAWGLWRGTVDEVARTNLSDKKACEALADRIRQAISDLEQFAKAESVKSGPGKQITQPLIDKLGKFVTPGLNAALNQRPSAFVNPQDVYKFTDFCIGNLKYLLGKVTRICPSGGQQAGKPGTPGETSPPPKEVSPCPAPGTPATADGLKAELKTLFEKVSKNSKLVMESSSQLEIEKRIQSLEMEIESRKFNIKQVTEDPGRYTPEDKHPATWLEELKDAQKEAEEDLKTLQKMLPLRIKLDDLSYNPCPGTGERLLTENVTLFTGTDNETWCTYGDGIEIYAPLIETDENGTPVEIATTEETATEESTTTPEVEPTESAATPPETSHPEETPPATEKPPEEPTTPETPPTAAKVPEEPTTPETPTAEKPPEEPVSEIPDTIFVKAKQEVLEGKPEGEPIENQVVKLFPPEEPALPGTGETKEAEDAGFDKDPVECTTGAGGDCEMQVPTDDSALYDLPRGGGEPGKNYRIDYDLPKDSGGVAETTGKPAEPDVKSGTPPSADVTYEKFKIGDRIFVRLVYREPYGLDHNFDEQFKPAFGDRYEEDYCREKQPGPPLGMPPPTYSALNRDLPEAAIRFDTSLTNQGVAP